MPQHPSRRDRSTGLAEVLSCSWAEALAVFGGIAVAVALISAWLDWKLAGVCLLLSGSIFFTQSCGKRHVQALSLFFAVIHAVFCGP